MTTGTFVAWAKMEQVFHREQNLIPPPVRAPKHTLEATSEVKTNTERSPDPKLDRGNNSPEDPTPSPVKGDNRDWELEVPAIARPILKNEELV